MKYTMIVKDTTTNTNRMIVVNATNMADAKKQATGKVLSIKQTYPKWSYGAGSED